MKATPPVIAALDFTASSPLVLRHAVRAAKLTDSPVLAVHVVDSSVLSHRASSGGKNPPIDLLTTQAERRLRELINAEFPSSEIAIDIRRGRPAPELTRAIEQHQAKLLVIAANDLTKKRLGSVASRCVRTAPCNVLVMRDWQDGPFTNLAVCTDFSSTAARALRHAVHLAQAHSAALEIIHVMYPPSNDIWGETLEHHEDSPQSYEEECRARVDQQMAAVLETHQKDLTTIPHQTVILESTRPAVALTHHIQDSGADLVILGTHGQSGIVSKFIGTNAEHLLHDATVSVLAVRD